MLKFEGARYNGNLFCFEVGTLAHRQEVLMDGNNG